MLHKFFEDGYWFAPKKIGYGSGLPIAWQGWVLLVSHLVLLIGFVLLIETGSLALQVGGAIGIAVSTFLLLWIAKKRTKGGWQWRR